MGDSRCVVCDNPAEVDRDQLSGTVVRCRRCGTFGITYPLEKTLSKDRDFERLRPYLSAYLRQATERGEEPRLEVQNWKRLAASHQTSIPEKLEKLLQLFGHRSKTGGQNVELSSDDVSLLDAADDEEASYLQESLRALGLLQETGVGIYVLTPEGWNRLAPSRQGGIPGTCFVAMSFGADLKRVFTDGIEPAILDCGFRVIRLDQVEHNDNINDKIIADLRSAQFVVADFTEHKGGVYFEAGFALGMGRSVIWTCEKSNFQDTHFDTRPYNHIIWTDASELKEKLVARIRATIPNAKLE